MPLARRRRAHLQVDFVGIPDRLRRPRRNIWNVFPDGAPRPAQTGYFFVNGRAVRTALRAGQPSTFDLSVKIFPFRVYE